MGLTPATAKQVPDHAILDYYNKQTYLGNRFTFPLTFTLSGTGENNAFILSNPVSGSPQNQAALFVDMIAMTGLTASATDTLRAYVGSTSISGGTAKTPLNLRTGSATTSAATLKSAPTATPGTLYELLSAAALNTQKISQLIVIDPGQTLLITLQGANSDSVQCALGWYEL